VKFTAFVQTIQQSQYGKAFMLALSLLTRLPTLAVNNIQPADSGRSALMYPLVGLLIGVLLYFPILIFPNAPPVLMAAIIITLWAIITGGLHLDGLADSSDAWLGGMGDQESIRRIMKDPLVGTAGVVSIVCILLLKFAALIALLETTQSYSSGIIILAPVIGRSMILLLFVTTQYVRTQGIATQMVANLPRNPSWWIIGLAGLLGIFTSLWSLVFVLLGFWLLRRMMLKQLGGCTGDTVGATVEISEMLWLIGAVLI